MKEPPRDTHDTLQEAFIRIARPHMKRLARVPSAYTESIYKRWFKQLQQADAALHRSEEAFVRSTMPEITVGALPQPVCFKDGPDRLSFLPEHVMQFMTDPTKASHWLKYTAKISGRTIFIHIVHYRGKSDSDDAPTPESKGIPLHWLKRYRAHVYKMYAWFHFISPYVQSCDCSKELNVYLYFTPFKKELPSRKGVVIGATHSNTGFTTSCGANLSRDGGKTHTEIVIYRYEEFFKVLLHETMHNLELDFGYRAGDSNVSHLFPGIRHSIILSETYVETWARLLNLAFYCYYDILGSGGTYPAYRTAVRRCLASERVFSLYQANRMLVHMGLTLQQVLSSDARTASLVASRYHEDTNVFAYYVIGGLATFEADLFLRWCSDTNRHNLIRANAGRAGTSALLLFIEMITSMSRRGGNSLLNDSIETVMRLAPTAPALLSNTSRMTLWSE
jgi:hypothetical protein